MKAWFEVLSVASKQGGVVTRAQARGAGLSEAQIDYRVAAGSIKRIGNGAYRVYEAGDRRSRLAAAIAVLPNAAASHYSAAAVHQLDRVPTEIVSVTVHSSTTHSFPEVQVFRTMDLEEPHVTVVRGVRVTTVARTIMDLAATLSQGHLGVVADEAVLSGKTSWGEVGEVFDAVARRGKPGSASLRKLLDSRIGKDRSSSRLERLGIDLLRVAGLDAFVVEFSVPWAPHQRFDAAYPASKVAIEWDSRRWHGQMAAFDADRGRDRECARRGWTMLRFTWQDVTERPDHVVDVVRAVLAR